MWWSWSYCDDDGHIVIILWWSWSYHDDHGHIMDHIWWLPGHPLCWSGPGLVDPWDPGWPPPRRNPPAGRPSEAPPRWQRTPWRSQPPWRPRAPSASPPPCSRRCPAPPPACEEVDKVRVLLVLEAEVPRDLPFPPLGRPVGRGRSSGRSSASRPCWPAAWGSAGWVRPGSLWGSLTRLGRRRAGETLHLLSSLGVAQGFGWLAGGLIGCWSDQSDGCSIGLVGLLVGCSCKAFEAPMWWWTLAHGRGESRSSGR